MLILFPLPFLQGLKARNFIHSKIEENIKRKVQESDQDWKHRDALQQLIDSSSKNGEPISMQVNVRNLHFLSPSHCSDLSLEMILFLLSGHQAVGYGAAVRGA